MDVSCSIGGEKQQRPDYPLKATAAMLVRDTGPLDLVSIIFVKLLSLFSLSVVLICTLSLLVVIYTRRDFRFWRGGRTFLPLMD